MTSHECSGAGAHCEQAFVSVNVRNHSGALMLGITSPSGRTAKQRVLYAYVVFGTHA